VVSGKFWIGSVNESGIEAGFVDVGVLRRAYNTAMFADVGISRCLAMLRCGVNELESFVSLTGARRNHGSACE